MLCFPLLSVNRFTTTVLLQVNSAIEVSHFRHCSCASCTRRWALQLYYVTGNEWAISEAAGTVVVGQSLDPPPRQGLQEPERRKRFDFRSFIAILPMLRQRWLIAMWVRFRVVSACLLGTLHVWHEITAWVNPPPPIVNSSILLGVRID